MQASKDCEEESVFPLEVREKIYRFLPFDMVPTISRVSRRDRSLAREWMRTSSVSVGSPPYVLDPSKQQALQRIEDFYATFSGDFFQKSSHLPLPGLWILSLSFFHQEPRKYAFLAISEDQKEFLPEPFSRSEIPRILHLVLYGPVQPGETKGIVLYDTVFVVTEFEHIDFAGNIFYDVFEEETVGGEVGNPRQGILKVRQCAQGFLRLESSAQSMHLSEAVPAGAWRKKHVLWEEKIHFLSTPQDFQEFLGWLLEYADPECPWISV